MTHKKTSLQGYGVLKLFSPANYEVRSGRTEIYKKTPSLNISSIKEM